MKLEKAQYYQFIMNMFNKRDKKSITGRQQSKINAIIIKQIIPYLKSTLENHTEKIGKHV